MKYKTAKLKNGAILRYSKNTITKTSYVQAEFSCGARKDKIPGLAHFTEHMFFAGTKDLSKEQINEKYFRFIDVNASTSFFRIRFNGNIFNNEIENYLSTVSMMINQSTFTQNAIDKEIPIVQQEIVKSKSNFDRFKYCFKMFNLTKDKVYMDYVLGSIDSVATIKSKDVKQFVKKWFVAENLELYVVSPLSFAKVKAVANKFASSLKSNPNFKKLSNYIYFKTDKPFFAIKQIDLPKNYIDIIYPIHRTNQDIEFFEKFNLLLKILNDNTFGIASQIRLQESLIYGGAFNFSLQDCSTDQSSIVTFSTNCIKENVNKVIISFAKNMKEFLSKKISQQMLEQVKRKYLHYQMSKEPRLDRDFNMLQKLKYSNKILTEKEQEKIIKNTTCEDLIKIAEEVFDKSKVSLSVYGDISPKELMTKQEFKKLFK